ncbi:phenylalanine--tRNA ligase subunit alpha [bacterium]|nr:phenylalanine--tRNA ligase subunit alpha [bacterium]
MEVESILQKLNQELLQASNPKQLEVIKLNYLGRSGIINDLAQKIKEIKPEQRSEFGKQLNLIKQEVTKILESHKIKDSENKLEIDNSIPDKMPSTGSLHPTTHAIFQIQDILSQIGFVRKRYREIDDDWHPFKALNMPDNHPARDEWETFFCENGKWVLTPHTSNGQIWEMENKKPPIKMLNITKTYRRQISPKHSPMFHQFEGLYVDKNVSIAHLKGTLDYFIKGFFGSNRETRIRPYHFKFTEPSFEVDITCDVCKGKGCKVCKAGWLEIGGAGMVHPNVLKNVGINSKVYNGFAFGFGVERPYMMKGDINIPDIRMFYTTKLDVLKNF